LSNKVQRTRKSNLITRTV